MLPGPIFRVELVSIARRRRYFILRTIYAALILLVLWITYSSSRYFVYNSGEQSIRYSAALAASFFIGYSWLQILAILLIGPAMAAGTIATERERRTIEYLFATDLSNAEIILGKTFARLSLMGQFVLVGLPILFLFRLLGGIPAEALLAIFISAASTATMLTGLSIAVSVWSPKARDAIVRVYLLLIALFTVPLLLGGLRGIDVFSDAAWQAIGEPLVQGISLLNPLSTLSHAMGSASAVGVGLDMTRIYQAVGSQLALALLSLGVAMCAVRRVHLGETTKSAVKRARWTIPSFRRPLGERPMIWKELFSPSSSTNLGRIGWVAMAVILFGILVFTIWFFIESLSYANQRDSYFEFQLAVTGYLGCGMLLLLAARSAGLISQEKERDCWISLLSTPLTGKEIIVGKLCGNLYSARWMLLVLGVSWGLGLLIDPNSVGQMVLTCGMFLIFATFASCLGLCFSLRSPTTLRAMGQTLGTLIFCGGGYLLCCCTVMVGGGSGREWEIILTPCLPFLLIYPGMAFLSLNSGNTTFFFEGMMPFAYVIGTMGYLIATASLYFFMVNEFDRLAGRTGIVPNQRREG